MHLINTLASLAALLVLAQADLKNHTQEYYLKTKLKPNQSGKEDYAGLYVSSYHTGAGLSDATLDKNSVRQLPLPPSRANTVLPPHRKTPPRVS